MSSTRADLLPHTPWTRLRSVLNWINLSTPLGLLVAWLGGATTQRHDRGTHLATGYRPRFPVAGAFTIGSVIITKHDRAWCAQRPALLRHEDRHCTQYAFVLGVAMLPLYLMGVAVSWVVAGDHWSYNPFERLADLAEGDYPPPRTRFARRT